MKKRIAIIGGGAAGIMVGATLCEYGREKNTLKDFDIHIFEKNKELGTKVRISGGGRCNVTTGFYKKQDLHKKYTRGRSFLEDSMGQFSPRKMASRCAQHGTALKCEEDMRVFPESDKSSDIVQMFERIMGNNVTIHFHEYAISVKKQNDIFIVTTNNTVYEFDTIVLTTGGNAYAHTGSTGDGYEIAKHFGHTTTKLGPSLNSFLIQEDRIKKCTGISFPYANLRSDGISVAGPLLCTHFGISGPVTFTYSSQIPYIPISSHEPHTILLIPFAERPMHRRQDRLNIKAHEDSKKQLSTVLGYEFTKRRVDAFLSTYTLDGTKMMCNVSRDERKQLAKLLGDGMRITLIARRPGDEFVTAGGINTDEVNNETMESKLCHGLYFAGEILNIDAVTGGFNFQSCWATGRCAGKAIIGV